MYDRSERRLLLVGVFMTASITLFGAPPWPHIEANVVQAQPSDEIDLSGEWDIEEEDKSYRAVLDQHGNGPHSWQQGRIETVSVKDRTWLGTWHQTGNDREGGFELLLSEDGMEARGVWWYTRVGDRKNIPPRRWGGSYYWKRRSAPSPGESGPAETPDTSR